VILEVAILDVKPTQTQEFETAFRKAQPLISNSHGYVSHQLQKCIEKNHRYIFLVNWKSLEDHTVGFRQSKAYQEWRALLHHFFMNHLQTLNIIKMCTIMRHSKTPS